MNIKPILVTGSHRSGTTWTGRTLAKAPNVGYIYEPFNIEKKHGFQVAGSMHWFKYICHENEELYVASVKNILRFRYSALENFGKARSLDDLACTAKLFARYSAFRMANRTPLMKDPIAIFSAEWLHQMFDMDVIVLIRHPAAFISSLKIKNWSFDFNHFLSQPLLMKNVLAQYEKQIIDFTNNPKDIIDQGILLWNCIHHAIYKYKKNYDSWLFLRHEDLSKNPIDEFRQTFGTLGLTYTEEVVDYINRSSSSMNPVEASTGKTIFRNSRKNITNWKNRLNRDEALRIKEGTSKLAPKFYKEEEW